MTFSINPASEVVKFDFDSLEIRTVKKDDEPWFVAQDICAVLAIKNVSQSLQALDDDERSMFNIGRQGEVNIVNESGFYSLVLKSRKPEAKKFRKWVTSEVLPAIRKSGSYAVQTTQPLPAIRTTIRDTPVRLPLSQQAKDCHFKTEVGYLVFQTIFDRAWELPELYRDQAYETMWQALCSRFGVANARDLDIWGSKASEKDFNEALYMIVHVPLVGDWKKPEQRERGTDLASMIG